MALTVDFVAAVRRQGNVNAQFSDTDILAAGDVEVQGRFLPLLREAGAEYFVRRFRLPIENGRCRIPDRSQVAGVRLVQWIAPGGRFEVLPQVQPDDDGGPGQSANGAPHGWYFDAGAICVVPQGAGGELLVRYYQRAPSMILSSLAAQTSQITAVTVTPTIVTINYGVTTALTNGDVVSAEPDHRTVIPGLINGTGVSNFLPSAFPLLDHDIPREVGDVLRTINDGDWVAPNRRTPFVPLPEELFAALVHRTAGVILHSQGYLEEANSQLALAEEVTRFALRLLTPRSDGSPLAWTAGLSRTLGQRRQWGW